jgi:deoxyuridine 5`-triphosphate nucleotidohydrolase|nr:MAG TPA: deoxyuridine 5'-triphosphate nucleotidohydrolase [Caudoviricetes sp.]
MRCFQKVSYIPDGILPVRKTKHSAGYDLAVVEGGVIPPHATKIFNTGIKVCMEDNEVLLIFVRSSTGIKRGVTLANGTAVIDADYYNNKDNEGHIMLALHNNTDEAITIEDGDNVAQGVFVNYLSTGETVVKERKGGIGSTNG